MTDVLRSIDDLLAERCACGCGTALDPNGPSAWYATADCQWRAGNQRTADPHDVYRRPDAAIYPRVDSAEQTLRELPTSYHGAGQAVDIGGARALWITAAGGQEVDITPYLAGPIFEWSAQERDTDGRWLPGEPPPSYTMVDETHVWRLEANTVYEMLAIVHGAPVITSAAAFRRLHLPPAASDDPMQRALEARRNRNTGPPQRVRPPRRIDATRSR